MCIERRNISDRKSWDICSVPRGSHPYSVYLCHPKAHTKDGFQELLFAYFFRSNVTLRCRWRWILVLNTQNRAVETLHVTNLHTQSPKIVSVKIWRHHVGTSIFYSSFFSCFKCLLEHMGFFVIFPYMWNSFNTKSVSPKHRYVPLRGRGTY